MAQRPVALLNECLRASATLDRLIADMQTAVPSQDRHDDHIDEVERLCEDLREAARGPRRPVNPPLWTSPDGFRAGW